MTRTEHLLVILMEECAEIQKEASKALRFGLDDHHPDYESNRKRLANEMADFMGIVEMLQDENDLELIDYEKVNAKKIKVEKYLEYSKNCGTLI